MLFGGLAEPFDQGIGDLADRHRDAAGHAALAGAAKRRELKCPHGLVEIGVGHDDEMVLGAAGRLDPLAVLRAGHVNVPGDRRRADERDRTHQRVSQERIDALLVAVHDVEDPLGQPRLHQELAHADRRQRDLFRGLQDKRVAADDRDREHPERDHRREIKRRDARAHADRVADRLAVDLAGDVGERLTHDQAGYSAGELDDLDAAVDRRTRFGKGLAVLARDQVRQLLGVGGQLFAKPEHDACPFDDRRLGPGGQGPGGRLHGPVDLFGSCRTEPGRWCCRSTG